MIAVEGSASHCVLISWLIGVKRAEVVTERDPDQRLDE